jgi:hypothetical protein
VTTVCSLYCNTAYCSSNDQSARIAEQQREQYAAGEAIGRGIGMAAEWLAKNKNYEPTPANGQTMVAYVAEHRLGFFEKKSYDEAYRYLKANGPRKFEPPAPATTIAPLRLFLCGLMNPLQRRERRFLKLLSLRVRTMRHSLVRSTLVKSGNRTATEILALSPELAAFTRSLPRIVAGLP